MSLQILQKPSDSEMRGDQVMMLAALHCTLRGDYDGMLSACMWGLNRQYLLSS